MKSPPTNPLAAIPEEKRRSLHELAEREQQQEARNRYWAKRLSLLFAALIAVYLAILYVGIPDRP